MALAVLFVLPATASAADLHATPATFASMFAGAQGGDRVLLASGSYGNWGGGAKPAPGVTIAPESGASPTFSGGTFGSSVRNITIQGVTYTDAVDVEPGSTPLNLTFDGDTWGNVGQGAHEGRLSIAGGGSNAIGSNGVQVKNSTFGPGGCSDGIQDSSKGTEIGPGNEFKGITQSCSASSAHVDSIQVYASNYVWIHDNYIHDGEQGIMSPDGPSTGYRIENNVIQTSTGYPCMHIGDNRDSTISHNVCVNGAIRLYEGNQGVASQNITAQNNVAAIDSSACSGCTVDHNVGPGLVSFLGGLGRCAYAILSPGTGSDGTPIGLNDCVAGPPAPPPTNPPPTNPPPTNPPPTNPPPTNPPPTNPPPTNPPPTNPPPTNPPPTNPPPPANATPTARFTSSPASPVTGQAVTFDAADSTCEDTPCTYTWVDDGFDGASGAQWPLGNGRTMSFTFRGAGVKNVRLTVADADGDTDTTMHPITVTTASTTPPPTNPPPTNPPPTNPPGDTTPPDTTIVSGPSGTTTDATPTFTFTSSESDPAFECQIDSGQWIDCTSPWTPAALSGGDHVVAVRSTDVAGNTDPSPATRSFTVAGPPPALAVLLGSAAVQPVADSVSAGSAEAFAATANASGSVSQVSVYVDIGNTAPSMVVGIYSDDGDHPGTLLTQGTRTGLTALGWNDVPVPRTALRSGQRYWIALLGLGNGNLRFRDGAGFSCHSEVSRATTLTTLPDTWQTGAVWASCDLAANAAG
jgi:hypothetical protein